MCNGAKWKTAIEKYHLCVNNSGDNIIDKGTLVSMNGIITDTLYYGIHKSKRNEDVFGITTESIKYGNKGLIIVMGGRYDLFLEIFILLNKVR